MACRSSATCVASESRWPTSRRKLAARRSPRWPIWNGRFWRTTAASVAFPDGASGAFTVYPLGGLALEVSNFAGLLFGAVLGASKLILLLSLLLLLAPFAAQRSVTSDCSSGPLGLA